MNDKFKGSLYPLTNFNSLEIIVKVAIVKFEYERFCKIYRSYDNNYDNPNDVSEYYAQDAVNALLKGEPVKMTKTVAIGCTIKVKK